MPGVTLRIGEDMGVKAYIDAAYGVHTSSGRSHTGCSIVLGLNGSGPVEVKSSKQKSTTKSSTEAELMALTDMAGQVMHLRNFIIAQGYEVVPAILYQDNLSCMALMKRGGPTSERSRHIQIRHFWIAERVADKEVVLEHLSTEDMVANALTKPVQGAQFLKERSGLTNWRE
jgi:histone deacetylase 1/2